MSCSLLLFPLALNNEKRLHNKESFSFFNQILTLILDKCDWIFRTAEVEIPKPASSLIRSFMLQVLCFFEDFSSFFIKKLALKFHHQTPALEPVVHLIASNFFGNTILHCTDASRSLSSCVYGFAGEASVVNIDVLEFLTAYVYKCKYLTKCTIVHADEIQL